MILLGARRRMALLLAIGLSATPPGWPKEEDGSRASAPLWKTWTTLRFETRPLVFFSGNFEMQLREQSGRRLLETRTRASFLGAELARSRSLTTIDSATGRTLEAYELATKRGRRFVFDDTGYTFERLLPSRGPDAPVDGWEVTSRTRFERPPAETAGGERPLVYDYFGLILHLRDAKLEGPGAQQSFWVATSDGPQRYRISLSDVRTTERNFEDLATGASRSWPVREFRLRISPADPSRAGEGLMKMEGDTEIRVEADTRTLLQIDGRIPHVPGRVEVTLKALG
jgi:hypothetical protein